MHRRPLLPGVSLAHVLDIPQILLVPDHHPTFYWYIHASPPWLNMIEWRLYSTLHAPTQQLDVSVIGDGASAFFATVGSGIYVHTFDNLRIFGILGIYFLQCRYYVWYINESATVCR
jgi:hypothetical protein